MESMNKNFTPDFIYNYHCRNVPTDTTNYSDYAVNNYYSKIPPTYNCDSCENMEYSSELNGYVHDVERAKVFAPFGRIGTMNKNIFQSQNDLYKDENTKTKWGHAPQLNPRPLTRIGLEWRIN